MQSRLAPCFLALVLCAPSWGQWTAESLSAPRTSLAAASAGRFALFAGGGDPASTFDTVDLYDAESRTWSAAQLSAARFELTSTSDGNTALFAGGRAYNGQLFSRVDRFDSSTETWSTAELSVARTFVGSAAGGGVALFAGGTNGTTLDTVDLYDFASQTWTTSTLSIPRVAPMVVWLEDRFLVLGGALTNVIDIYDPATGSWTTEVAPAAPIPNGTCVAGGQLVLLAAAPSSVVDVVYVRAPGGTSWTQTTLPFARTEVTMVGAGPLAYFAGGESFPIPLDRVDVYDTRTGTWSLESLPGPQRQAVGLVHYGRVMVAGGAVGALVLGRVSVLEPSVGQAYCSPNTPNSTGSPGHIDALGLPFAEGGALALVASDLPPGEFTLFLASFTQGFVPAPTVPSNLCIAMDIGRFTSQVARASAAGVVSISVDTGALPQLNGPVAIQPGETVHFQAWHRDGMNFPHFTDATSVAFQ